MLRSLYMKKYVFFVQMPSHVLAAVFFERYVRYFGSLHPAFEMSCDTEYLEKNSFWFFRKRGLRRFGLCAIVLMIFVQTFRKNNGRSHQKENINFPKRRWIRSKNVCLSSALLFSLVLTKNYVLRTSWGLSTWNNTCFLFKCRVTFRLGQFSKARFGSLALYILRLRCLAVPNTYKNSFWFFSETWSSLFRIVCNCFDDFRTNFPKNNGRSHQK